MNSVTTKLTTTLFKSYFPSLNTHWINSLRPVQATKVAAAYRHTKSRQTRCNEHGVPIVGKILSPKIRKRIQYRQWNSFWKSLQDHAVLERSTFNQYLQNERLPGLTHVKNILNAQPEHVWRAFWASPEKEKVVEWPIFNRGVQYECSLKNLLKTRSNVSLDLIFSEKELKEIQEQQYLPHRVRNLGPDLAAVHFFTDRRAAVKLANQGDWIVGGSPKLTNIGRLNRCISGSFLDEECYLSGCHIEALDCTNFRYNGVRFEGLKYLAGLKCLKWLSLRNQKHINVWCLDRIAGLNGATLEYLDISKCDLDLGCIVALMRMPALRTLVIKNPGENVKLQKALSFLEEANKKLNIRLIKTDYA